MSKEAIIQSFEDSIRRNLEQSHALREATRNRLVWFVGIAAFALLNGKNLWESVAKRELKGLDIFFLSIPWLFSALLALITHFIIDRSEISSNMYHNNKLAELSLLRASIRPDKDDSDRFSRIIKDEDPEIMKLKLAWGRWAVAVNWVELLSLSFLVIGFIWSILFPLLLK